MTEHSSIKVPTSRSIAGNNEGEVAFGDVANVQSFNKFDPHWKEELPAAQSVQGGASCDQVPSESLSLPQPGEFVRHRGIGVRDRFSRIKLHPHWHPSGDKTLKTARCANFSFLTEGQVETLTTGEACDKADEGRDEDLPIAACWKREGPASRALCCKAVYIRQFNRIE
jgi:hypothetical protein